MVPSDPLDAEVFQWNYYYPFGMGMEGSWSEVVPDVDQNYLYNGKEMQDDLGLDWLDYGARMYDPAIARWNAVDPLAEKYYSYSGYNYVLGNPISFIDPDGRSVDHVIITGDQADQATEELNKSSSLTITRDGKSGKLSATGKATNKADKKLLEAINSTDITVELKTTSDNTYDSKDGTKDIPLTPGGFEGSEVNGDGTVTATQIVNVDNAKIVSGILGESTGETLTHEVNEAYIGAVQTPGGDYGSAYKKAHKAASKLDSNKGGGHGSIILNYDAKRNMMQVRKDGTSKWTDIGSPKRKHSRKKIKKIE